MGVSNEVVTSYAETLNFIPEKSRLELGSVEVSYHCDKFNTRILKNFEDVLGFDKGSILLKKGAETTTYDALKKFLNQDDIKANFDGLSPEDKVKTIFEMFKVSAYGALEVSSLSPEKSVFISKSSYLAEGWLENKEKFNWADRDLPVCHDISGHLCAVLSIVYAKPVGSFKIIETKCRAKGDDICEFVAEVNA